MSDSRQIVVPGRVNLIGEHIDYHNLPVLPMAIPRHISLKFSAADDEAVRVESQGYGVREIRLNDDLAASADGDWANYLKAAVKAVQTRWPIRQAFHGQLTSSLPAAAGLSSSSALITAFTLGLLRANEVDASLKELMAVLPEGEQFVGTRGGGMDHAAVLASRAGHASLIHFAPFGIEYVHVPTEWRFLVAHSLVRAEKSGAAKARYNACRAAGLSALPKYGLSSYQGTTVDSFPPNQALTWEEYQAIAHVVSEAERVREAVAAMRSGNRQEFGAILNSSHESLRLRLQVSCPALDRLVEIARAAGADGARLTGAGFGGCAIVVCSEDTQAGIIAALERNFYSGHAEYRREEHLLSVLPSNGALYANQN